MIVHISKNKKGNYIAMSSTLEIAKLIPNMAKVVKVDTDQLTAPTRFQEFIEAIGLTPKDIIDALVADNLDAQPEDTTNWHPCTNYGDGAWVIYKGKRAWVEGTGNIPSTQGGH